MHDRTKRPRVYTLHAEPLQYRLDLQDDPKFRFTNKVAVRKQRQRDREAMELRQYTVDLHEVRLIRALTAELLTDIEALNPQKVEDAITRIVNKWIAETIVKAGSKTKCHSVTDRRQFSF